MNPRERAETYRKREHGCVFDDVEQHSIEETYLAGWREALEAALEKKHSEYDQHGMTGESVVDADDIRALLETEQRETPNHGTQ